MTIIDKLKEFNLSIDLKELAHLKKCVKNSFNDIEEAKLTLKQYPFLNEDISHRMSNNKLFQPGRIVETIVTQLIANSLDCTYTNNGCYVNEQYLIKQDGGSSMPDTIIYDKITGDKIIFEIREPIAYGKVCGFTYDDNGKPQEFTSKNEQFRDHVKSLFELGGLLEKYNILDNQGHNSYYETTDVILGDFNCMVSFDDVTGNLIFMTKSEYKEKFNFRIEIRPCGRNTRKVFTPSKLNLVDGVLFFKKSEVSEISQRGGRKSSRYKYISNNATFSFQKKSVTEKDSIYSIPLNKINQHVGEVSIQHFI